jgi:carbamoyltransferase
MRILSLYFGHDSSVCLLENGQATAVIEKERVTRRKHDQGWMEVESVLRQHAWSLESVDCVVVNPDVYATLDGPGQAWDLTGSSYLERGDYLRSGIRCQPETCYSEHEVRLFGRRYPCLAVDHHVGHIAAGFYTSAFERATILSADGGGDEHMCAAARAEGGRISEIEYGWGATEPRGEINIGSVWGSVGQFHLGQVRLEAAGKLMGLASYGRPRPEMVAAVRQQAFADPFRPLPAALVTDGGILDPADAFTQDLAASLQAFTTEAYVASAQRLAQLFGGDRLVLTGGCSMNCVANTAVHTCGAFADTWVPAQPGDCGLALGQALFAWHHVLRNPRTPRAWSPYLGNDAGSVESGAIIDEVVSHLLQGRVVGLCTGRAENGPRALGHRSILADPRLPDIRDRLNATVKFREWYRPYAPMVLEEDFDRYFAPRVPSKYMSYVTAVLTDDLPGITHVDRSTRPQVVGPGDGVAWTLLQAWKRRAGIGVLLNTSLNAGEPMVDTAEQALDTWRRTGLDVVVSPLGTLVK